MRDGGVGGTLLGSQFLANHTQQMKTENLTPQFLFQDWYCIESLDQVESRHLNNIECCVSPIFRHYILESLCYTM